MNNYYGWTSELVLFNAGSSTASGSITYYGGAYPGGVTYPFSGLAPNQTLRTNFAGATNTLYSARIGSSQPLAGIVRQYSGSVNEAYNALSTGSTTNYAPLIMNNYYGWDTSVTVQNTTGASANVTVRYYDGNGNQVGSAHSASIPGYNNGLFYSPNQGLPNGFIGTARISSDQPVVAVVNQSSPHGGSSAIQGMSYAGSAGGGTWAMIPEVRNYTGAGNWISSVNIQNLSASSNGVTLSYGGQSWSATLAPNGFKSFYIPNYFGTSAYRGPAPVSASFPIAVVVNHSSATINNVDTAYTYDGLAR